MQKPIGSGLGVASRTTDATKGIDLSGKVPMVTGGYSGIGPETSRVLSEAGATLLVPTRSPETSCVNLEGLPRFELAALDLMDPKSIDVFAKGFLDSRRSLDLMIHNAGVRACPQSRDGRRNESQFSADHIGHFHLTLRLWPALIQPEGTWVI